MTSPAVRRAHDSTHFLHVFCYFTPETDQRLVALGLDRGRMCYFAGRAAPMGAVGAGVVTATFYSFSPALVARCVPEAWRRADPAAVAAARLDAVDDALTRLLGTEMLNSADLTTLAGLAREAATACHADGRPLYAAHADLDWPDPPHLVLWHALTLLREHRGDGHIAALLAAGLSGIEAQITHIATGRSFLPGSARRSRGWSEPEWAAATDGLVARGLLDGAGALTPTGRALREHVEHETDRMAAAPWQHLGDAGTAEVIRIGTDLTAAIRAAGAIPADP